MSPSVPTRSVVLPVLLGIERGATSRVPAALEDAGIVAGRILVVTGRRISHRHATRIAQNLERAGSVVTVTGPVGGTVSDAWTIARAASDTRVDLILGVGGGAVIDVAKLAARIASRTMVSIPTTLANDGISSPVASLRDTDGIRRSHPAAMPTGVIVDLDIVASAPRETILAGFGDLLSNLMAVLDWRLAGDRGQETFDAFSAAIAEHAALPALNVGSPTDPQGLSVLASGLVVSGLAMATAGNSRPCSGAEHLISHRLDEILGPRAGLHGLQVALGSLVSAAAHGRHLDQLHSTYTLLGLPTTSAAFGLSHDDVVAAIQTAPRTRPNRYTILDELALANRADVHELVRTALAPAGERRPDTVPRPAG